MQCAVQEQERANLIGDRFSRAEKSLTSYTEESMAVHSAISQTDKQVSLLNASLVGLRANLESQTHELNKSRRALEDKQIEIDALENNVQSLNQRLVDAENNCAEQHDCAIHLARQLQSKEDEFSLRTAELKDLGLKDLREKAERDLHQLNEQVS